MPLDSEQAFKAGFLARCVEDGLGVAEILGRVKAASELLEKDADLLGGAAGAGVLTLGALLGAPAAIGGGLGWGAAKLTDVDDTDVEDMKREELRQEYLRQALRVRNEEQARRNRAARKPGGRALM